MDHVTYNIKLKYWQERARFWKGLAILGLTFSAGFFLAFVAILVIAASR